MKIILFLSALFLCFTLRAEVKICAHCGKGSRRMLYSAENKFFCSRQCAKAKFSCSHCGKIPKGRYMMIMGNDGQYKRFCGSCSQMKKCFSCHYPTPNGKSFEDGRIQCLPCSRNAVTPEKARQILNALRSDLSEMYGYDTRHRITLRLVSKSALQKIANSNEAMGCMKTQVTTQTRTRGSRKKVTKKWQCTLYLLDNLPQVLAAKVIAHELTHDHLYHHAGSGAPPKVTEGICEAVSAQWLQTRGFNSYVEAMQKNEKTIAKTFISSLLSFIWKRQF